MQAETSIALKIAATGSGPRVDGESPDTDEATEVAREIAAEIALDQLAAESAARAEYDDESARPGEVPASGRLISGLAETAL